MKIILLIILIGSFLWWGIYSVRYYQNLFEYNNPFSRTCKKCGAHQNQYCYSYNDRETWWEEMYPIGNDPNCKCHSYADNHG
jgi:hypothetical protein